ncbi:MULTISPECIES: glycoside hydrolase family 2 protein [unclassified Paenibacillus]|uniref:glycoside hydrolase family 2 protein n=1 Tax=unclassified Paenibacillus TaxID=185978 RepID=UPI003634DA7F
MIHTQTSIPRPEFPRPDWQRTDWLNLNGSWSFGFDPDNRGIAEHWFNGSAHELPQQIMVPFSWVSPLSGIGENVLGIGWYSRAIKWAPAQQRDRIFLRFGAVDYHCDVWVNQIHVGRHSGGYGTFEFDVTEAWKHTGDNSLVVRVKDNDEPYQARGKQGYGEIRGIWQTVWLEARPDNYVQRVQFTTQLDGTIEVQGIIHASAGGDAVLSFSFDEGQINHSLELSLEPGVQHFHTSFQVTKPRLWSPETPHLYEGMITLESSSEEPGDNSSTKNSKSLIDNIATYFGIRTIGTIKHEGMESRWITLNDKPIFLNGTLDQSFHPTGFFTYPTDEEMRDEIYRLKRIGLNMVRIHIKPEEPRKLYWADKLGMLVMEDMPCFWGTPDDQAKSAYEPEALETIYRDWNHPSIYSWVMFNETWGLLHESEDESGTVKTYMPETQQWVKEIYEWAKSIDSTRLVEDNSPCRYDHVESDLNTWHFYLNGYQLVRDHIEHAVQSTRPGSNWNYIDGHQQSDAPLMNSECGAVWGIEGSAGDSDLAWQYRYMLNEFRRHDKICGFVFTEFKDVTNEFNGYYRIDDSDKDFGYEGFIEGMSLYDLHRPDFVVIDAPPCTTVNSGQTVSVSLAVSSFADTHHGKPMQLSWELWYDSLGCKTIADHGIEDISWNTYGVTQLPQLQVQMPRTDAVAILAIELKDPVDPAVRSAVARNFITFDVRSGAAAGLYALEGQWLQIAPTDSLNKQWDYTWQALNDHKVNGSNRNDNRNGGFFEYDIDISSLTRFNSFSFGDIDIYLEAAAKVLLAKDQQLIDDPTVDISYMHGRKADPGMNLNSYYMTDAKKHFSTVQVYIDGQPVELLQLPDDPADSRGVLSWHYQQDDRKLDEAGSYGYLQRIRIPSRMMPGIIERGSFRLKLEVPAGLPEESGGLCLYGRNAGRYPIDILVNYK